MEKCHYGRLQLMKGIMQQVADLKKDRALEVACGDGRLSKDLLSQMFTRVDLFDQDPTAIDIVKAWSRGVDAVKSVKLATMQTF